jgi:type IV pilus assembly protein PilV
MDVPKYRCQAAPNRHCSSGLTLIEVMVALVVMSIGLAGLASMHLNSVQYVHSAYYRSLASVIATDFEERLWLEIADHALTGCPGVDTGEGTAAAALVEDWTRDAVGDTWNWSTGYQLKIPDLNVTMGTPVTTLSWAQVPVTLSWNENRFNDEENTTEQFTYTVRIPCRPETSEDEEEA